MERPRRSVMVALAGGGIALAAYLLRIKSPEERVLALVTELARAGGLSGKADPPAALAQELVRALSPHVEVWTPEQGRNALPRPSLVELLVSLAHERQGIYSLYDLRVQIQQGSPLRARVRARIGPLDRRNHEQGLDARDVTLRLHEGDDGFRIDSVELSAPLVIEPEARP
jgi:hypothetical protein